MRKFYNLYSSVDYATPTIIARWFWDFSHAVAVVANQLLVNFWHVIYDEESIALIGFTAHSKSPNFSAF
ncbi:MAG: hypothetical protein ACRCT1_10965 [Microcoleaceae cyanobacterium]